MRSLQKFVHLRRIFVEFLKVAFTGDSEFPFTDNPETSKILIFDSWHNSDNEQTRRPRIIVSRGRIETFTRVIGDKKEYDILTGDRILTQFKTIPVQVNILADSDIIADDIAAKVEDYLLAAKQDFGKRGVTIIDYQINPPIKMRNDSPYPKSFVVRMFAFVLYNYHISIGTGGDEVEEFDVKIN